MAFPSKPCPVSIGAAFHPLLPAQAGIQGRTSGACHTGSPLSRGRAEQSLTEYPLLTAPCLSDHFGKRGVVAGHDAVDEARDLVDIRLLRHQRLLDLDHGLLD